MTLDASNRAAELLRGLLALLRAQYWHYQNAHWTVKGVAAYGDHKMFQSIYEGIAGEIDVLAEKCVAYFNGEVVNPESLAALMQGWLRRWSEVDCLHKRSLMSESDLQGAAKGVYDLVKADDSLSLGLDDFLMAMANKHETHTYLVQQIVRGMERMASLEASWEALGKVHPSEDARRKYLQKHPKSDPKKHTVRQTKPGPKDKPKSRDVSKQEGFERLKGMSPEQQRRILQRALAMGGGETGAKDVSKQEGFERLKGLSPGKQRQVIERALRMAALEDAWERKAAPVGGWSAEMTPLEKTWGGFSSFRPIRRGEEEEDEDAEPDLLDENDLISMWFKTDNDEGYFRPPPQWSQLQDLAGEGETPVLDEAPFSGWTLS